MRVIGKLGAVCCLAACAETADTAVTQPVAVLPSGVASPREGATLPDPQVVTVAGRPYTFRFAEEAGMGYSAELIDGQMVEGEFYSDLALVGGTDDHMEAVAVYLLICHGETEVPDIWGDEPLGRLTDTREWAFSYPDDCGHYRGQTAS